MFCGRGLKCFPPLRGKHKNIPISPVILFELNTLKGTAKVPSVGLNTPEAPEPRFKPLQCTPSTPVLLDDQEHRERRRASPQGIDPAGRRLVNRPQECEKD